MNNFTKQQTIKARNDLTKLLEEYNKANPGFEASLGNARFGAEIEFKLNVRKIVENEFGSFKETKQSKAFRELTHIHNLREDLLNQPFNTKEGEIRLIGYNTRASKNPMNFTINGKNYASSVSYFKGMMKESGTMSAYLL